MSRLTHRQLCEIGSTLLQKPESANGHGCHFAIAEPACYGENPDVFGIRHGSGYNAGTVLLEAKTSRSDFLADKKKPHRIDPATGIGKWRYFICPTDLIKPDELPDLWGLIYVSESGRCKYIKGALAVVKDCVCYSGRKYRSGTALEQSFKEFAFTERNVQNEFNLLTMALARLKDPEQILYMQRNYTRLESRNYELSIELSKLRREVQLKEFHQSRSTSGEQSQ
ncbi:adenylosuccinate synthase [Acinetobacter junii]|uniref:adenylosuccinate synthase n=1 Tax=Acinetobacter junii TaxID=40215 RepID=UPI002DB5DFAA|nr:adenylosuccinate synthase [Acinetobacter junii]MEB8381453.1 adenylosuccinate synthase [Acinetobacter junii]